MDVEIKNSTLCRYLSNSPNNNRHCGIIRLTKFSRNSFLFINIPAKYVPTLIRSKGDGFILDWWAFSHSCFSLNALILKSSVKANIDGEQRISQKYSYIINKHMYICTVCFSPRHLPDFYIYPSFKEINDFQM